MGDLANLLQGGLENAAEEKAQSCCGRLMNSLFCALCVAPVMMLAGCYAVGWNERHSVCEIRAIDAGMERVKEVGCDTAPDHNDLVMFTCPLKKDGLEFGAAWAGYSRFASLGQLSYVGTGLSLRTEMYQCVEKSSSRQVKNAATGQTTTVTDYSYALEWQPVPVDSSTFHGLGTASFGAVCGGAMNPKWPDAVPRSGELHAPAAKVGPFTIPANLVGMIPLSTPVDLGAKHMQGLGWNVVNTGVYQTTTYSVRAARPADVAPGTIAIGTIRMTAYGNNWDSPDLTVYGNNNNGKISDWEAPATWLCSGFSLEGLRTGAVARKALFRELADQADTLKWILRMTGFALLWIGFCLVASPLNCLVDSIPLIGPVLGDAVNCVTCTLSCCPALIIATLIGGVVWVVMRPAVGVPLLLICLSSLLGLYYYQTQLRPQYKGSLTNNRDLERQPGE